MHYNYYMQQTTTKAKTAKFVAAFYKANAMHTITITLSKLGNMSTAQHEKMLHTMLCRMSDSIEDYGNYAEDANIDYVASVYDEHGNELLTQSSND